MTAAGKEPETAAHQVFISYASEDINSTTADRQVADQICSALESQGIHCWIAHRDILPGDEWMEAIIDAVDQTKIIVLVFSANTEKSQWVKDEIKLALDEKRMIIPFRIQEVYPLRALKLLKVRCQWMHAFTPPLEKHIENLVKIVSRHLGIEPAIPIKKEKLKVQPGADQVKPAAKKIKAVEEETKKSPDMPENVKKVISKAHKIDKNKNGYWEAYYKDYDITMIYIPPGKFMMGSVDGDDYEKPLHEIDLDGYWIGKYEVTFAQYERYCNEAKIEIPDDKGWGRENRPVIYVSWDDAAAYCQWLSQKTGLKFKLPTEAQWEKAARGNDQRKYPWGSREPDKDLANFSSNIGKTTPVDSYPAGASTYGLLDMAGNVWEWCSDWYKVDYYKNSPPKNPEGPNSGSNRVFRGGGWSFGARILRCAFRGDTGPSDRSYVLGFRRRQDI
jgi:formylglycine-generating enzyme required for sulfatase activity